MSSSMMAFSTLFHGAIEPDPDDLPPAEIRYESAAEQRVTPPLKQIPPGPWRSLGRRLDYTNWADRDRFRELDRAIQTSVQNGGII